MRFTAILAVVILLCAGCKHTDKAGRPSIAVSFPTQASILNDIVGDDFDIITLLPSGSDPETYQPTISTMKAIGNAEAYFTLGTEGFEEAIEKNLHSNFPDLKIIDCTEGVAKLTDTHHHAGEEASNDHSGFDPHIMASIRNSRIIVGNLGKYMARLHPEKKKEYSRNAEALQSQLQALDDSISGIGLEGKGFVIRHPSLSYFARDYGLEQIALNEVGKETSPLQLGRKFEQAEASRPKAFLIEREHANPSDRETARQLGLPSIEISLNSPEWISSLKRIADEIDRD